VIILDPPAFPDKAAERQRGKQVADNIAARPLALTRVFGTPLETAAILRRFADPILRVFGDYRTLLERLTPRALLVLFLAHTRQNAQLALRGMEGDPVLDEAAYMLRIFLRLADVGGIHSVRQQSTTETVRLQWNDLGDIEANLRRLLKAELLTRGAAMTLRDKGLHAQAIALDDTRTFAGVALHTLLMARRAENILAQFWDDIKSAWVPDSASKRAARGRPLSHLRPEDLAVLTPSVVMRFLLRQRLARSLEYLRGMQTSRRLRSGSVAAKGAVVWSELIAAGFDEALLNQNILGDATVPGLLSAEMERAMATVRDVMQAHSDIAWVPGHLVGVRDTRSGARLVQPSRRNPVSSAIASAGAVSRVVHRLIEHARRLLSAIEGEVTQREHFPLQTRAADLLFAALPAFPGNAETYVCEREETITAEPATGSSLRLAKAAMLNASAIEWVLRCLDRLTAHGVARDEAKNTVLALMSATDFPRQRFPRGRSWLAAGVLLRDGVIGPMLTPIPRYIWEHPEGPVHVTNRIEWVYRPRRDTPYNADGVALLRAKVRLMAVLEYNNARTAAWILGFSGPLRSDALLLCSARLFAVYEERSVSIRQPGKRRRTTATYRSVHTKRRDTGAADDYSVEVAAERDFFPWLTTDTDLVFGDDLRMPLWSLNRSNRSGEKELELRAGITRGANDALIGTRIRSELTGGVEPPDEEALASLPLAEYEGEKARFLDGFRTLDGGNPVVDKLGEFASRPEERHYLLYRVIQSYLWHNYLEWDEIKGFEDLVLTPEQVANADMAQKQQGDLERRREALEAMDPVWLEKVQTAAAASAVEALRKEKEETGTQPSEEEVARATDTARKTALDDYIKELSEQEKEAGEAFLEKRTTAWLHRKLRELANDVVGLWPHTAVPLVHRAVVTLRARIGDAAVRYQRRWQGEAQENDEVGALMASVERGDAGRVFLVCKGIAQRLAIVSALCKIFLIDDTRFEREERERGLVAANKAGSTIMERMRGLFAGLSVVEKARFLSDYLVGTLLFPPNQGDRVSHAIRKDMQDAIDKIEEGDRVEEVVVAKESSAWVRDVDRRIEILEIELGARFSIAGEEKTVDETLGSRLDRLNELADQSGDDYTSRINELEREEELRPGNELLSERVAALKWLRESAISPMIRRLETRLLDLQKEHARVRIQLEGGDDALRSTLTELTKDLATRMLRMQRALDLANDKLTSEVKALSVPMPEEAARTRDEEDDEWEGESDKDEWPVRYGVLRTQFRFTFETGTDDKDEYKREREQVLDEVRNALGAPDPGLALDVIFEVYATGLETEAVRFEERGVYPELTELVTRRIGEVLAAYLFHSEERQAAASLGLAMETKPIRDTVTKLAAAIRVLDDTFQKIGVDDVKPFGMALLGVVDKLRARDTEALSAVMRVAWETGVGTPLALNRRIDSAVLGELRNLEQKVRAATPDAFEDRLDGSAGTRDALADAIQYIIDSLGGEGPNVVDKMQRIVSDGLGSSVPEELPARVFPDWALFEKLRRLGENIVFLSVDFGIKENTTKGGVAKRALDTIEAWLAEDLGNKHAAGFATSYGTLYRNVGAKAKETLYRAVQATFSVDATPTAKEHATWLKKVQSRDRFKKAALAMEGVRLLSRAKPLTRALRKLLKWGKSFGNRERWHRAFTEFWFEGTNERGLYRDFWMQFDRHEGAAIRKIVAVEMLDLNDDEIDEERDRRLANKKLAIQELVGRALGIDHPATVEDMAALGNKFLEKANAVAELLSNPDGSGNDEFLVLTSPLALEVQKEIAAWWADGRKTKSPLDFVALYQRLLYAAVPSDEDTTARDNIERIVGDSVFGSIDGIRLYVPADLTRAVRAFQDLLAERSDSISALLPPDSELRSFIGFLTNKNLLLKAVVGLYKKLVAEAEGRPAQDLVALNKTIWATLKDGDFARDFQPWSAYHAGKTTNERRLVYTALVWSKMQRWGNRVRGAELVSVPENPLQEEDLAFASNQEHVSGPYVWPAHAINSILGKIRTDADARAAFKMVQKEFVQKVRVRSDENNWEMMDWWRWGGRDTIAGLLRGRIQGHDAIPAWITKTAQEGTADDRSLSEDARELRAYMLLVSEHEDAQTDRGVKWNENPLIRQHRERVALQEARRAQRAKEREGDYAYRMRPLGFGVRDRADVARHADGVLRAVLDIVANPAEELEPDTLADPVVDARAEEARRLARVIATGSATGQLGAGPVAPNEVPTDMATVDAARNEVSKNDPKLGNAETVATVESPSSQVLVRNMAGSEAPPEVAPIPSVDAVAPGVAQAIAKERQQRERATLDALRDQAQVDRAAALQAAAEREAERLRKEKAEQQRKLEDEEERLRLEQQAREAKEREAELLRKEKEDDERRLREEAIKEARQLRKAQEAAEKKARRLEEEEREEREKQHRRRLQARRKQEEAERLQRERDAEAEERLRAEQVADEELLNFLDRIDKEGQLRREHEREVEEERQLEEERDRLLLQEKTDKASRKSLELARKREVALKYVQQLRNEKRAWDEESRKEKRARRRMRQRKHKKAEKLRRRREELAAEEKMRREQARRARDLKRRVQRRMREEIVISDEDIFAEPPPARQEDAEALAELAAAAPPREPPTATIAGAKVPAVIRGHVSPRPARDLASLSVAGTVAPPASPVRIRRRRQTLNTALAIPADGDYDTVRGLKDVLRRLGVEAGDSKPLLDDSVRRAVNRYLSNASLRRLVFREISAAKRAIQRGERLSDAEISALKFFERDQPGWAHQWSNAPLQIGASLVDVHRGGGTWETAVADIETPSGLLVKVRTLPELAEKDLWVPRGQLRSAMTAGEWEIHALPHPGKDGLVEDALVIRAMKSEHLEPVVKRNEEGDRVLYDWDLLDDKGVLKPVRTDWTWDSLHFMNGVGAYHPFSYVGEENDFVGADGLRMHVEDKPAAMERRVFDVFVHNDAVLKGEAVTVLGPRTPVIFVFGRHEDETALVVRKGTLKTVRRRIAGRDVYLPWFEEAMQTTVPVDKVPPIYPLSEEEKRVPAAVALWKKDSARVDMYNERLQEYLWRIGPQDEEEVVETILFRKADRRLWLDAMAKWDEEMQELETVSMKGKHPTFVDGETGLGTDVGNLFVLDPDTGAGCRLLSVNATTGVAELRKLVVPSAIGPSPHDAKSASFTLDEVGPAEWGLFLNKNAMSKDLDVRSDVEGEDLRVDILDARKHRSVVVLCDHFDVDALEVEVDKTPKEWEFPIQKEPRKIPPMDVPEVVELADPEEEEEEGEGEEEEEEEGEEEESWTRGTLTMWHRGQIVLADEVSAPRFAEEEGEYEKVSEGTEPKVDKGDEILVRAGGRTRKYSTSVVFLVDEDNNLRRIDLVGERTLLAQPAGRLRRLNTATRKRGEILYARLGERRFGTVGLFKGVRISLPFRDVVRYLRKKTDIVMRPQRLYEELGRNVLVRFLSDGFEMTVKRGKLRGPTDEEVQRRKAAEAAGAARLLRLGGAEVLVTPEEEMRTLLAAEREADEVRLPQPEEERPIVILPQAKAEPLVEPPPPVAFLPEAEEEGEAKPSLDKTLEDILHGPLGVRREREVQVGVGDEMETKDWKAIFSARTSEKRYELIEELFKLIRPVLLRDKTLDGGATTEQKKAFKFLVFLRNTEPGWSSTPKQDFARGQHVHVFTAGLARKPPWWPSETVGDLPKWWPAKITRIDRDGDGGRGSYTLAVPSPNALLTGPYSYDLANPTEDAYVWRVTGVNRGLIREAQFMDRVAGFSHNELAVNWKDLSSEGKASFVRRVLLSGAHDRPSVDLASPDVGRSYFYLFANIHIRENEPGWLLDAPAAGYRLGDTVSVYSFRDGRYGWRVGTHDGKTIVGDHIVIFMNEAKIVSTMRILPLDVRRIPLPSDRPARWNTGMRIAFPDILSSQRVYGWTINDTERDDRCDAGYCFFTSLGREINRRLRDAQFDNKVEYLWLFWIACMLSWKHAQAMPPQAWFDVDRVKTEVHDRVRRPLQKLSDAPEVSPRERLAAGNLGVDPMQALLGRALGLAVTYYYEDRQLAQARWMRNESDPGRGGDALRVFLFHRQAQRGGHYASVSPYDGERPGVEWHEVEHKWDTRDDLVRALWASYQALRAEALAWLTSEPATDGSDTARVWVAARAADYDTDVERWTAGWQKKGDDWYRALPTRLTRTRIDAEDIEEVEQRFLTLQSLDPGRLGIGAMMIGGRYFQSLVRRAMDANVLVDNRKLNQYLRRAVRGGPGRRREKVTMAEFAAAEQQTKLLELATGDLAFGIVIDEAPRKLLWNTTMWNGVKTMVRGGLAGSVDAAANILTTERKHEMKRARYQMRRSVGVTFRNTGEVFKNQTPDEASQQMFRFIAGERAEFRAKLRYDNLTGAASAMDAGKEVAVKERRKWTDGLENEFYTDLMARYKVAKLEVVARKKQKK